MIFDECRFLLKLMSLTILTCIRWTDSLSTRNSWFYELHSTSLIRENFLIFFTLNHWPYLHVALNEHVSSIPSPKSPTSSQSFKSSTRNCKIWVRLLLFLKKMTSNRQSRIRKKNQRDRNCTWQDLREGSRGRVHIIWREKWCWVCLQRTSMINNRFDSKQGVFVTKVSSRERGERDPEA